MQTSAKGLEYLQRHEGVVLRAYRCPAGVWTIGAGLTAASGVVTPRAGMVISHDQATALLRKALAQNYEPAVARAMARTPRALQHEFDAGVSFHFNTGAIARASWVRHWLAGDWPRARAALMLWNRAGGRVLAGLTRRRSEEFELMKMGLYGHSAPLRPEPAIDRARIAAPVTAADLPGVRRALAQLGYAVGTQDDWIAANAVRAFQAAHGLTEDGIIGRATMAMITRVLDSRARAASPLTATVAVAGGVEAAAPGVPAEALTGVPLIGEALIGLAVLRYVWLAVSYRDTLSTVLLPIAPRLAAFLRSF